MQKFASDAKIHGSHELRIRDSRLASGLIIFIVSS